MHRFSFLILQLLYNYSYIFNLFFLRTALFLWLLLLSIMKHLKYSGVKIYFRLIWYLQFGSMTSSICCALSLGGFYYWTMSFSWEGVLSCCPGLWNLQKGFTLASHDNLCISPTVEKFLWLTPQTGTPA